MRRLIPQRLVEWWCGRYRQHEKTVEWHGVAADPAAPNKSVAYKVQSCRCGKESAVSMAGGQFPRGRS